MREQKQVPKQAQTDEEQNQEGGDHDRLQLMRRLAQRKIQRSAKDDDSQTERDNAYFLDEKSYMRGDDAEAGGATYQSPEDEKLGALRKEMAGLNGDAKDGATWTRLNEIQSEAYQLMRDAGMTTPTAQRCRQLAEEVGQQITERETPFLQELDGLIDDYAAKVNDMAAPGWWQPEILESLDDNIMRNYICHPQLGIAAPFGIRSAFSSKPGLQMRLQRMEMLRDKLGKGERKSGELQAAEGKANAAELKELSAKHRALASVRKLILGWGCNEIGNLVGEMIKRGCIGNAVGNALENSANYLFDERFEKRDAALEKAGDDPDSVSNEQKADVKDAISQVQLFEPLQSLTASGFHNGVLKLLGMIASESGKSLDMMAPGKETLDDLGKTFDGKDGKDADLSEVGRNLAGNTDALAGLAETIGTNVGMLQEIVSGSASGFFDTLLTGTAAVSFWGKAAVATLDVLGWGGAALESNAADAKLEEEQNNQADIETYMGGLDHAYEYKYLTQTGAQAMITIGARKPL